MSEENETKEFKEAKAKLRNAVYKAAVDIFEPLEYASKIYGNGHHLTGSFARVEVLADGITEGNALQEENNVIRLHQHLIAPGGI